MANIPKGQAAEVQGDNRTTSPTGVYVHDDSGQKLETARGDAGSIQGDALLRLGFRLATEQEVEEYRKSKSKVEGQDGKLEVEKEREEEAARLQREARSAQKQAEEAKQNAEIAAQGAQAVAAEAEAANSSPKTEEKPEEKTEGKSNKKSGGNK